MRSPALLLSTALLVLAACESERTAPEPVPPPAEAPPVEAPIPPAATPAPPDLANAHGIDVSHHSGAIDWGQVAAEGYAFAYVKATEGVDDPDPLFDSHWQALAEHGLHRGAYHFFVTEDDPEEQARFFLSQVDHRPGDLAPVVDIEVIGHGTVGEVAPKLHRFLEIVEQAVGVRPMIYTSPKFWNAHLDDSFAGYPLWVAEYEVDSPAVPRGWSSWTLWQFEGDADVPGVEKGADRSRFHPDADPGSLRVPAPAG